MYMFVFICMFAHVCVSVYISILTIKPLTELVAWVNRVPTQLGKDKNTLTLQSKLYYEGLFVSLHILYRK